MKRFWILMLTLIILTMLASCDIKAPEATTEAPTEVSTDEPTEALTQAPTEEPTEAPTEEPTEEEITLPPATEEATIEWSEPDDVPYDVIDIPVISTGTNKEIHGYNASGEFSFDRGDAWSTQNNNMFIVTNDRIAHGKITATFFAPEQYVNDNGIIFGMNEDEYEQYYFWEDGPTYYFLFVSDDCNLYLAKVSNNGQPWTELHISTPIPDYKHGDVVMISVEFDGEGLIDCYANGEYMFTYYDENWTGGSRYGIRCEVPDVCYTEVIVDHEWVSEW